MFCERALSKLVLEAFGFYVRWGFFGVFVWWEKCSLTVRSTVREVSKKEEIILSSNEMCV